MLPWKDCPKTGGLQRLAPAWPQIAVIGCQNASYEQIIQHWSVPLLAAHSKIGSSLGSIYLSHWPRIPRGAPEIGTGLATSMIKALRKAHIGMGNTFGCLTSSFSPQLLNISGQDGAMLRQPGASSKMQRSSIRRRPGHIHLPLLVKVHAMHRKHPRGGRALLTASIARLLCVRCPCLCGAAKTCHGRSHSRRQPGHLCTPG